MENSILLEKKEVKSAAELRELRLHRHFWEEVALVEARDRHRDRQHESVVRGACGMGEINFTGGHGNRGSSAHRCQSGAGRTENATSRS